MLAGGARGALAGGARGALAAAATAAGKLPSKAVKAHANANIKTKKGAGKGAGACRYLSTVAEYSSCVKV